MTPVAVAPRASETRGVTGAMHGAPTDQFVAMDKKPFDCKD
jgi:hypothetical protein